MTLARLTCRNFRNLEEATWEPGEGSHLLVGDNGAGKTSLLEAIYVAGTTRSFRTSRLADCRRHGSDHFHLVAEVVGDGRSTLELSSSPDGATRQLNGNVVPLTDYLDALPVVSWTDGDFEWISGSPAARRRLIDRGAVSARPGALTMLTRYRRALDQKRELLAGGAVELEPWNEVLSQAAYELISLRRRHIEELAACLSRIRQEAGESLPEMSLEYRPSPASSDSPEAVLEAVDRAREGELARRSPLVGPHRDELELRWGEHPARKVASLGERKLLGLAVTAARARLVADRGRNPVVLLDDLDAALDEGRLEAAWRLFGGFPQVLVTSSRPRIWADFPLGAKSLLACGKLASEEPSEEGA